MADEDYIPIGVSALTLRSDLIEFPPVAGNARPLQVTSCETSFTATEINLLDTDIAVRVSALTVNATTVHGGRVGQQ